MSEYMNARDGKRLADEAERQLAQLLAVEPSPEFAANVRARIAQEPAPAAAWRWWALASVPAAIAVVFGMVMLTRSAPSVPPAPPLLDIRLCCGAAAVRPQTPDTPGVRSVRRSAASDIRSVRRSGPSGPRSRTSDRVTASDEPEVLIDPALARAVRRLAIERPLLPAVPPDPSLDAVVVDPLRVPDVSEFAGVRLPADQGRR